MTHVRRMNALVAPFAVAGFAAFAAFASGCGGSDGKEGPAGADGMDGRAGADGRDGTDGTDGMAGANGREGGQGADGMDGSDGAEGNAAVLPGVDGFLLVAELAAGKESIHVYSLPELKHTGTLDNILLGNHLGALALADGRVIATNQLKSEIIAIQMNVHGKPFVVDRVAADLGPQAMWGCADERLRYLAVASGHDGNGNQTANIVKLDDFTLTRFETPVNVIGSSTEELHPYIAGYPEHLFLGLGGEIQAFPLADVLAGTASTPGISIALNTGSHGPVVAHDYGRLYFAAAAGTGFDGVDFALNPFARADILPWDVDGRSTGRNARPRLSWDGRYIYGAVAQSTPTGAENWAQREVDFHIADLETEASKRVALTTGIVPKFQLSQPYAFFANVTGSGDFAVLVDVDEASATFQQVVARVPLAPLVDGPVAGQSAAGKQARGSAITPDGKWAFVSHGGEGKVSVIDTASKSVAAVIETPTTLSGGGYLIAVQPGVRPVDTCTR